MPQSAYKFETSVGPNGKVELAVPIPPGTLVEVFILAPGNEDSGDLLSAAASSLEFWNNQEDDEDWNHA